MNKELVDIHIIAILKKHGWYENRIYDCNKIVELLKKDGYKVNEHALKILEEFGGISVNETIPPDLKDKYNGATFDFFADYGLGQDFLRIPFEDTIGESIFPIGRMCDATVFVSETNKIYIGDTEELICVGIGMEAYLNYLFVAGAKYEDIEIKNWFENLFK